MRRAYGQSKPILADQLGVLTEPARGELETAIGAATAMISSGKFSQASRYAELIRLGDRLWAQQRRQQAEAAREQRAQETARRRVADHLRDVGPRLAPDTLARLSRALRAATDLASISAVEAEVLQAVDAARSGEERRRDREISRTRSRIARSSPKSGSTPAPAEDWQEVLRRLQEQLTARTS